MPLLAISKTQVTANQSINTQRRSERRKKTNQIKLYGEIDRNFFSTEKPTNPMEYIDNDKQKVHINPGVPYVSTSQNEIFERRILLNQKEQLHQINPMITRVKTEVELERGPYSG